jgi:demethylmenaquinone methyltransferase/2-methoxy-6-polyprenyl-1,4-benzoquinol methylase
MKQDKPAEIVEIKTPPYYREEVWAKLAWFYDPLMKLILLPFGGEKRFRKQLVDFANPQRGEEILDICSGTGTLTSLIAERVGNKGRVVGIDLSSKMIEIARKKAKSSATSFQNANSERLPFPEGMFDKVFVSFGLHEMPEDARRNTLREVYRTLKLGGSLFVLDYSLPQNPLARFAVKVLVRLLEEEFSYRMLLNGSLIAEIKEAGFEMERQELIGGGMLQMIQAKKAQKGSGNG